MREEYEVLWLIIEGKRSIEKRQNYWVNELRWLSKRSSKVLSSCVCHK